MTEPKAQLKIPAPPPLSQTLVRRILGFGVWVVVGLAPFLGTLPVPLLPHLLELYPHSSRLGLLAFSGFLMGAIALVVENAGAGRLTRTSLQRWFRILLMVLAASFALLVVLYPLLVVRPAYQPSSQASPATQAFVTGTLTVPMHPRDSECRCPAGQAAERCIEDISFNEGNVQTCFGPLRVKLAGLALTVLYLFLTGSFAAMVGVFVLRQKMEKDRRR